MEERDFVFWLNGFLELENPKTLDKRQTQIIKDHLKLVFQKETPNRNILKKKNKGVEPKHIIFNDNILPQNNNGTGGTLYCASKEYPHGRNGLIC